MTPVPVGRWRGVFWVVVAMLATLVVAFFVLTHFSEEEGHEPDEGHLEDLLDP